MMYAATLPSDATLAESGQHSSPVGDGMRGCARLEFVHGAGKTRLKDLYQTAPLRVLFPGKARGDVMPAVLVTTSGGLVGGDFLDVEVKVGPAAAVQIIGQAAEKIYRSTAQDTIFETSLNVDEGAWLEWLPQETIIFDQARLRRRTCVNVAPGGSFFGAEFLVFGRAAMGETLNTGVVRDVWEVRRAGKLHWADALHLTGDVKAQLDHPAGFGGARAAATSVLVMDDVENRLDCVRDVLEAVPKDVQCAATVVNGVLVTRWMAFETQALRDAFAAYWSAMRCELKGLPRRMPRLWNM